MFVVVSYDISNDKNRAMIFKLMKKYGLRVQYSVFEGEFSNIEIDVMLKDAKRFIDESSDSLRLYCLCASCRDKIRILGSGEVSCFPPVICV